MTDHIAGFRVVKKDGHPGVYLHDELHRCVAWTRPGDQPGTTEIRVLQPHVPLAQAMAGDQQRVHRRCSYVVADAHAADALELLARTIRAARPDNPATWTDEEDS